MPQQMQLALVAGGALLCALTCAFLLYRNRGASPPTNWKLHLAEIIILCVGMLLLSGWINRGMMLEELYTGVSPKESYRLEAILVGALFYGVFALPVLLLARFVRARFTVALFTALWLVFLTYRVYLWKSAPIVQEVRAYDTLGLIKNSLMLDMWVVFPRIWTWALLSVLGGFYAVRKSFSYVALIFGTVVAGYIILYLMSPFAIWNDAWIAPLCFAAFAVLLVKLPLQRAGLEKLLGIRLTAGEPPVLLPVSFWSNLGTHALLLLAFLGLAVSAFVNYFERIQISMLRNGPKVVWHSPAQLNAYDDLKTYFSKDEKTPLITAAKTPDGYGDHLKLIEQVSTATRQALLSQVNRQEYDDYFNSIGEFTRAMEMASKADYLRLPNTNGIAALSFLNLRETIRAIGRRAVLAYNDGQTTVALRDAETLFRMGGLMRDQTNLVMQMIGVVVRNTGTYTAWNLLAMGGEDPVFLRQLAQVLETVAPVCRVSLDYEALSRGEPGMTGQPILTNVSIVMPAFMRAHVNTLVSWMNFDRVMLGVALQRYKLDHGVYPEQLSDLVPAYLDRAPRDPLEGREYTYRRTPDGWYDVDSIAYEQEKVSKTWLPDALILPPMVAPDDKAHKK